MTLHYEPIINGVESSTSSVNPHEQDHPAYCEPDVAFASNYLKINTKPIGMILFLHKLDVETLNKDQ